MLFELVRIIQGEVLVCNEVAGWPAASVEGRDCRWVGAGCGSCGGSRRWRSRMRGHAERMRALAWGMALEPAAGAVAAEGRG